MRRPFVQLHVNHDVVVVVVVVSSSPVWKPFKASVNEKNY